MLDAVKQNNLFRRYFSNNLSLGVIYCIVILGCFVSGNHKDEMRRKQLIDTIKSMSYSSLYGTHMHDITIPCADGTTLNDTILKKKWTLMLFASLHCQICESEARLMAENYSKLNQNLNIVLIFIDKPLFTNIREDVYGYARIHGLLYKCGYDVNGSLAKQFHIGNIVPIGYLLDKSLKVRLAFGGSNTGSNGLQSLLETLNVVLNRSEVSNNAKDFNQHLKMTTMLQIVTFITGDHTVEEAIRLKELKKFAGQKNVSLMVISKPGIGIPMLAKEGGYKINVDNSKSYFKKYEKYKPTVGPVTLLLAGDKVIFAESGRQIEGFDLLDHRISLEILLNSTN